jgi:regulator of protease activity HflC (stomatin/prohibitin superfamily)
VEFMDLGIAATGLLLGGAGWLFVRYVLTGFFTVDQNERAVKVRFGRADRLRGATLSGRISEGLRRDEAERYDYPQLRVIRPGGPYFRWPWEQVRKVTVAVQTVNMAWDPESPSANHNGTEVEAVTKDQLNTGLSGQIRFRVSENNLYAFLFAIKNPIAHVMGYFVSILRERIANFEAPKRLTAANAGAIPDASAGGVSINDIRKNLRDLNEQMEHECRGSDARYGIVLDASLITGIDPPREVESALAAINTAHNLVSSDISLAQAAADQRVVQSRRAVEIETLKAQAEVEPLLALSRQLTELKRSGPTALTAYLRNVRLSLYQKAQHAILGVKNG